MVGVNARIKRVKWPNFRKVGKEVRSTIWKVADGRVHSLAVTSKNDIKRRLLRQDFPSFRRYPLSPAYAAEKARLGQDPRTMIRHRHYVEAIRVIKEGRGKYRVGFEEGEVTLDRNGNKTNIPIEVVARTQEFGSAARNIPPRAHWKPAFSRVRREARVVRREIGELSYQELRRRLRR